MFTDQAPLDASSLHEDMLRVSDRLPTEEERRRVRHLDIQTLHDSLSDDHLADVILQCPLLESLVLSGAPETTDRTVVLLAQNATHLHGLNLSNCVEVTDVGILELTNKSLPLQWLFLNGVIGLTDPSISAIAKTCSRLVELELCDLPLLTPLAVRDIWSYSRKLRVLRLANCPLLSDKAFPAPPAAEPPPGIADDEKPLPHRPTTWLENLPPLILRHCTENLRILDLTACKVTDDAVDGIVVHAPKIQTLILSGCIMLTDRSLESICKLGDHLDVLMLAHVSNITDRAVFQIARSCPQLRCVDVAFCRNLTDMAVFELACLARLRRLSLVRVHKITDLAVCALAEQASQLERLHLSYCDQLSLDSIHLLLRKSRHLQHLTATGVPAFRRQGVHRFSDPPPPTSTQDQQAAFRVFTGDRVAALRHFLDKEEQRQRDAEANNIPFVPRDDDKLDLY
ncbi:RNI-like protein [Coprinellus micaceus]|uniref:RNI-like protein n=1 Tax=Coprinellus micaceus TaxID=71717 RepID=A0A4Y7TQF9_COPMI|nr:RNI-like protein [Coprinellus micaceus]